MNDPVIISDPEGAGVTLLAGDVREALRGLPAESVHCCITSPPYWGLRAYGTEPQVWGGRESCEHEWGSEKIQTDKRGLAGSTLQGTPPSKHQRGTKGSTFCQRCGAWRGELGQEPTPALFVEHLVEVFREVRRVLRPDGTLWLNLGDCYAHASSGGGGAVDVRMDGRKTTPGDKVRGRIAEANTLSPGLKPKDLCEIPSDVVRALRADGWWLRSRIPWLKRNAMPESTNDRPTQAVEYVFLLTPSARYFYDGEAVKEPTNPDNWRWGHGERKYESGGTGLSPRTGLQPVRRSTRARRNSDWFFESWQGLYADDDGEPLAFIVNPAAFKAAHFATFPPKLVEPMVKAGTSEKGACPVCGKPWERVVEKQASTMNIRVRDAKKGILDAKSGHSGLATATAREIASYGPEQDGRSRTLGWRPGCECPQASSLKPQACVVLDPFSGAGTTALVAVQHGRRAIGIDLSEKYNRMAATRIGKALRPATFVDEQAETDMPLLAGDERRAES